MRRKEVFAARQDIRLEIVLNCKSFVISCLQEASSIVLFLKGKLQQIISVARHKKLGNKSYLFLLDQVNFRPKKFSVFNVFLCPEREKKLLIPASFPENKENLVRRQKKTQIGKGCNQLKEKEK